MRRPVVFEGTRFGLFPFSVGTGRTAQLLDITLQRIQFQLLRGHDSVELL